MVLQTPGRNGNKGEMEIIGDKGDTSPSRPKGDTGDQGPWGIKVSIHLAIMPDSYVCILL